MAKIDSTRPDGEKASGWLSQPSGAPRGNVVVVQEWWGLSDHIKNVCDRLAAEGFRALAPDLYDGFVTKDAAVAEAKLNALDFPKAVSPYIRGAAQQLQGMGGKVAVLGFCMGGALTLLSAANVPELSSAVCFYGIPPASAFDPATIKVPLLAHFAHRDDWCTPSTVDQLESRLKAGNVPHTLHRYDAQHAFFNDHRPEVHDPASAKLAWERSIAFLREQLA